MILAQINDLKETSSINGSKWAHLLAGIACGVLFFAAFFYLLAPNFFSTGFSIRTLIALGVVMGVGVIANQQLNLFNRSSMIEHSYKVTNKVLSGLPDYYTVYNNVCIGEAKMDHVVVGNNGVFIVLDRSVKGVVHCDEYEKRWTIDKTGRQGGSYTSSMGNPLKQLKWQIHTLAKYLKDNGINIWIDGCVFFSNADSDLVNKPSGCFDSDREVVSFIMNYSPKKNINPQMINRVKDHLAV